MNQLRTKVCRPLMPFVVALLAVTTAQLVRSQAVQAQTVQTLPGAQAVTYLGRTPGWFICDSLDSPVVAELGWPDARGLSRLTTYPKARPGTYAYRTYRVGGADPGAGQIHYPFTPAGPAGGVPYSVGSFNTGVLDHPEQVLTPNIVSLDAAGVRGSCRWTLNTRLLGFDARRSVLISESPDGTLTYQAFNFTDSRQSTTHPDGVQRSSVPSLSITGGHRTLNNAQESFVFQNAGYTYTVRVARQGQPAGASVTLSRGGKVIQTETLTGYTYAVRR